MILRQVRGLDPVSGLPAVVFSLVVPVVGKEQGGPGDPRPGWFHLAPVVLLFAG